MLVSHRSDVTGSLPTMPDLSFVPWYVPHLSLTSPRVYKGRVGTNDHGDTTSSPSKSSSRSPGQSSSSPTHSDAWTGRAHIVTRLNSIGAFLKMIKTRYLPFFSFPSLPKLTRFFPSSQIRRNPPTSTQNPPSNSLRKHKPPPPQRLRLPILQKATLNAASCRPCRVENPGTHGGAQGHPGAMG